MSKVRRKITAKAGLSTKFNLAIGQINSRRASKFSRRKKIKR